MCAHAVVSQAMFVAQMAFFARVADPAIGGTAMTLFNTIANLGAPMMFFCFLRLLSPPVSSSARLLFVLGSNICVLA